MTTISIDEKEYDLESISDEAREQLIALQFTDQLIARAQQELAVLQTARNAYAAALRDILAEEEVD